MSALIRGQKKLRSQATSTLSYHSFDLIIRMFVVEMFAVAEWFDFCLMLVLTLEYLTLMVAEISTSFHYSLLVADVALH